jgi:hypothetical protein
MTSYIITEEMIKTWRTGCINLSNPHTNDDICKKCKYRGKGMREKCCDFGDTDVEKIFRSHLYNPQAEQENLVRMILIEIIDYIDAGYEADEIQKIYEEKFDIKLRQSKDGE